MDNLSEEIDEGVKIITSCDSTYNYENEVYGDIEGETED